MQTKTLSKFAALLIVGAIMTTAVPMTTATNIVPSTVPEIKIGANITLSPAGINAAREYTCGGSITCLASTNSGTGNASLLLVDDAGPESGEQSVAFAYKLVRACNGQNTTKPFTIHYTYGYTLDADVPLLVQNGAATATVQARAKATDAGVPTLATLGSDNTATFDLAGVVIQNNTVYETGLAGKVTGAMTDTLLPDETVTAFAEVRLGSIALDFHDLSTPTFNYTVLDPPAHSPNGDHLGYVNTTSVVVRAQAYDPPVVAGLPVGQSCVETVTFAGNGQSSTREVDYFQSEVQSHAFTGDEQYEVSVTAEDYQGNVKNVNLEFIIDSVAPDSTIEVVPTQLENGGKNGWYKSPAPSWHIECIRDSNPNIADDHTAPCQAIELSEDGGASFRTVSAPGAESEVSVTTTTGASVQGIARSTDYATNLGQLAVSDIIKVDILKPTFSIPTNQTSEFSNGWYRDPASIDFLCVTDDISGCGLSQTSTDGGATWTNQTHYECAVELDLNIAYGIEDMAGNRNAGSKHFGCDFTDPTDVPFTNLTTPTFYNDEVNTLYSNVTPTWGWAAQSDPVSNGVRSLLRGYEVFLNDEVSPRFVSTNSFTTLDIEDGLNCISVRSLDNAGNRGELTEVDCVFVDRKAPVIQYNLPAKNTMYFEGQAITITSGLDVGVDAIVVGPIVTGATATDSPRNPGEDVSKLNDVQLIETIVPKIGDNADGYYGEVAYGMQTDQDRRRDGEGTTGVPCDNINARNRTCAWSDDDGAGELSASANIRNMYVRAWDNANNRAITWRNYTRVEVGPIEQLCNAQLNQVCTRVYYDGSQPAGTVLQYTLHRDTTPDFTPSLLNQIGSRSALAEHYIDDTTAEQNKVYYYRLVAVGASASLTSLAVKMVTTKQVGHIADF